jgi:uncharacterized LabA/DUF88 family protein
MNKPKTHVYIDGANIFYTQKHLGWNVDWKKTLKLISKDFDIIETRYYTGIKNNDEKMKKYLRRLREIGIKTITKPLKIIRNEQGDTLYKSNCDVEMAVDIILGVNHFDVLTLFSGDSDFVHVVKILQKQFQKKVRIYSSRKTISWEIRIASDAQFFLEDMEAKVKRNRRLLGGTVKQK